MPECDSNEFNFGKEASKQVKYVISLCTSESTQKLVKTKPKLQRNSPGINSYQN